MLTLFKENTNDPSISSNLSKQILSCIMVGETNNEELFMSSQVSALEESRKLFASINYNIKPDNKLFNKEKT